MKKHLKQTSLTIGIFLLAAVITSCGRKEQNSNYIARVDDSYLNDKDLAVELDTTHLQDSHKNEYIRNWIETEVLYKEAVKKNIFKDDQFNRTLEDSRKELAKSFLINKILSEAEFEYNDEDLETYYNGNKNNFILSDESYLYNMVTFINEDKAILFRNTLIESDWNKTTNVFRGESTIVSEKSNELQSNYQIQPYNLYLILQNLMPGEVSIIMDSEPSYYTIVQLLKVYHKGDIPEFGIIKKNVKERFLMEKRKEYLRDYIRDLYSKYEIEIK